MSRQTSSGSAAQNTATLKQLVKLESNKSCADCKRNKHPRWASWNLGIFICIRCSGIHRGMGTHISRVKSVDLDTWTDEQMQSMVKWGNARANRYWESKLAEGHVPNDAKIENFIRTKYDSRRWAMDGPIPDPSTLGGEDDDVPLNLVQQNLKAQADTRGSGHGRNGSLTTVGGGVAPPPRAARQQPQIDLFGDEQPARASSANPVAARSQPVAAPVPAPAPRQQTRPQESLLGLDFFGGPQAAPPARAATTSPSGQGSSGRSDLKQSILSLYASKPAAPPAQGNAGAFGGMQSPPLASPSAQSASSALGGLGDAFGSLSFSSPAQQPAKPAAFSNFLPPAGHAKQASVSKPTTTSALSGGSFFDTKPAVPPKQTTFASSDFDSDFGAFSSAASPAPQPSAPSNKPSAFTSSNALGDLFSLAPTSAPTPPPKSAQAAPPPAAAAAAAPNYSTSAFNLSQPNPAPPKPAAPAAALPNMGGGFNNMDAWGSSDAWATPDPPKAAAPAAAPPKSTTATTTSALSNAAVFDSGWGNESSPSSSGFAQNTSSSGITAATNTKSSGGGFAVQQDEEFGGWSHASPVATPSGNAGGASGGASKGFGGSTGGGAGGGGGGDDLFGNVWG